MITSGEFNSWDTAFAVSMALPPPTPTVTSAPNSLALFERPAALDLEHSPENFSKRYTNDLSPRLAEALSFIMDNAVGPPMKKNFEPK
jgi:hypothetical protein